MTGGRPGPARRALDLFYGGCGLLAGISLVGIAVLVMLQIVARLAGFVVSWTAEFAGYAMAAASFLALAYTFNTGGHIRVMLVFDRLPRAAARITEALCLLAGTAICGFFAWNSAVMTWQSYQFNEMGQGSVAVPLWIPQIPMTLGLIALAVSLLDNLLRFLRRGTTAYQGAGSVSPV